MANSSKHRHGKRYRQIANTLARHGLGYFVGLAGLERLVPFEKGWLGHARRPQPYTRPEHVRIALEELGTTFMKLGQILSTRPDLLPPNYLTELARLQDAAPALPFEAIKGVLAAELDGPLEEVFATFDPEALAAGSIGQAHAATLPDGTEVVVKVRKPGVVEQVEDDLEILQDLAATISRRWELADRYDLVGLAQEFAETLRAELDYMREGRSAERFAASFEGDKGVHVPRIYWEATTDRVLTMERVRGIKINDLAALDAAGIDRKALAQRAASVVLKMVFEDGFFHADPHPGNFFIEPGGRIGLIDFGMVGTLDGPTQERLVTLLLAIASKDGERLVDAFLELGLAHGRMDRTSLRQDLDHLLSRYYDLPLGDISIGPLLEETLAIVRRHHLQLPSNLALLIKTLIMHEGLGLQLDPTFNLTAALAPYAQRLMLQQYSPFSLARRLGTAGVEMAQLGAELPRQLRRIVAQLERGDLEVGMRPQGFDPVLHRLERLANRIVIGIIAAAFINGLAILMSVYHPAGWEEWAGPLFAFGFLAAAALGVYLAWSILRSGRN
ncbi:MAG: AarF/ABC1/UbiB kinase family protein [Chloroflexi bacterium]|nr:AarF/ABC1/UbiB kinase family protein [Chloroflexota bacterium]